MFVEGIWGFALQIAICHRILGLNATSVMGIGIAKCDTSQMKLDTLRELTSSGSKEIHQKLLPN